MAIEQDHTVTVGTGATAKTFGVSKSLDQYTIDDLKTVTDWCFSAFEDNLWNANIFDGSFNKTSQVWDTGKSASVHLYKFPSYQIFIEGSQMSGSLFTRNVLIYCNTAVNWLGANIYHGLSNLNRYHIVTDIELQELKLYLGNNPDTVATYIPSCKLGINDVRICPMQLIIDGEDNIYLCLFENWNGAKGGAGNRNSHLAMRGISYDNVEIAYYNYNSNNGMKAIDGTQNKVLGPSGIDFALHTASNDEVYTTGTELIKVARTSSGGYNYFDYTLQSANTDTPYLTFAYGGLRFNDGRKDYKPIVENGMITGYTDDDSVTSEFDSWTSIKDHVTPSEPPTPTPPEEDPRDASIYGTYSGGAGVFARCWYCNQNALNSLWLWSGGSDNPDDPQPPEGFSPINSIIGLQLFPVNIPHTGSKTAIVFFNSVAEGDRTVNTHVSDDVYLGTGKTFKIDLGSVTVDAHHTNDWAYLDYDETVELYIPFCGVYPIDTQVVMGKTITAKLYVDPIAGTCTFIATCDNVDVAMGSGSMAVSLPVTANQYSMTLAAINTNRAAARNAAISSATVGAAQVGASFASGYSSGYKGAENQMLSVAGSYDDLADIYGAGNPVRIARGAGIRSGLSNAATSISNGFTSASIGGLINSALNTRRANKMLASSNNTAVSGSFGGSQDTWRLPMQAYIKTIRYMTKIPNNHVDVIGKIFLQETTLAKCSGYTTVANPNLSSLTGFLTTAELTELYGILLNGIYAGGGAE